MHWHQNADYPGGRGDLTPPVQIFSDGTAVILPRKGTSIMKATIYDLQERRQAMTKQFTLLATGVGGAFFRAYIRRQCLRALHDMQSLDDSILVSLGLTRHELAEAEANLQNHNNPPEQCFPRCA
jgi:hypothetical protein